MFGRGVVLVLCVLVARPCLADAPEIEIARGHSRRGAEHYAAARFREAAAEFELARKELPLPELDFNLGRCYEGLGDVDAAIVAYRRFLARKPDAAEREDTERRVALLEVASPRVHERLERTNRLAGDRARWRALMPAAATLAGIAVGAAVGSGVLYGHATNARDLLAEGCPPRCEPGAYERGHASNVASMALFGVAVGAAAIDVALWGAALRFRARARREAPR